MWMCIRQNDDGSEEANVSFGIDPEQAYKFFCDNICSNYRVDEMFFYELPNKHSAEVTWTLTPVGT